MMMRRLPSIVVAIGLLGATAIAQQPPRPSFDWFIGTWDVTYDDAVLGPVSGQAMVSQTLDGSLLVRYLVTDPRDQKTYELTPFNVQQTGDVITMELPMGGPSAATTVDGNPAIGPAPAMTVLAVPVGEDLRATLQGTEHSARVGAHPAVANPQLRLVRKGERLEGEWRVRRDSESGFRDARLGRRDVELVPGPAGATYDIMRGPEVWQTARIVIDETYRSAWTSAAAPGISSGIAHVTIRGLNLAGVSAIPGRGPVPGLTTGAAARRSDVRFTDLRLIPDNTQVVPAADSITVPVDILGSPSAIPGPKSFVLSDPATGQQANSTWVFDWPVLDAKSIFFSRNSRDNQQHYPTAVLYPGELFYVDVDAAEDDPGRARMYGIESTGQLVEFHLVRNPEQPTKFRAGPFLLLAPGEPIPAGSGALDPEPIPLDHESLVTPDQSRPFVVRAHTGERIRAYHIAAQAGERARVVEATAEIADEMIGEGRYQVALAKARELRRLYPDEDRYVVTRFRSAALVAGVLTSDLTVVPRLAGGEFSRRTLVSTADHAALIVLLDELTFQVEAMQRWHQRQFSKTELIAYGAALSASAGRKIPEPLFGYQVAAYEGTAPTTVRLDSGPVGAAGPTITRAATPLNAALYPFNLQQEFGNDRQRRDDYVARVVGEAITQLVNHLALSRVRLDHADISSPEELLRIVKPAYAAMAPRLMQHLMRRSRVDRGEPAHPRWVADEPGRVAVRGIADLLGAIASDEQLATQEWTWLSLAAAPVMIAGGVAAVAVGGAAALAMTTVGLGLNAADLAYNATTLSSAIEDRNIAYDVAPVAGYDAYDAARGRVSSAKVATALSGAGVLLEAAGTAAAVRSLAAMNRVAMPTPVAMQSAATQALGRGTDSLSPAARTNLAVALDSAVDTARTKGVAALTPLQRDALRASFPDGIPDDVAKSLNISPSDPNFVIKLGDSTVDLSPFPAVSARPVDLTPTPPVPPRQSSNPLIRRLYGEAEDTARRGVPEAQARMARLERAAAEWERLPSGARGTSQEAMEILTRMRRQNPAFGALDEAEALDYFNLHSRRTITSSGGAAREVLPEELVAEFAAWKGVSRVSPDDLAGAANISRSNAEAALFAAERRIGTPRTEVIPAGRRFDPNADTLGDPPAAVAPAPQPVRQMDDLWNDPRRIEIAERLKQMGVPDAQAEFGGIIPAARGGDIRAGTAAAAMNGGVPPDRVMKQMGLTRQQLEPMLDDYLRRFEVPNDAQRRALLARYFGDAPSPAMAVPPRAPLSPPPARPRGLAPPAAAPAEARAQVDAALQRMGVPPAEIKTVRIDDDLLRGGALPDEIAAGVSRQVDVDSRTAARALGTDERGFAGLVDHYEARVRPNVPAAERAAEITSRLRADDVTEPYTKVMQARQDRIDAALRDLGLERGDPVLTTRGVDPESAVVGEALSRGVAPDVVQARRGLSPERVAYHVDDYLQNGRGVQDAGELARQRTQLLSASPVETATTTVRLPPNVIAAEHELADALALLRVDRVQAAHRASNLANLARNDAHQAIVVGAWQSRAPPAVVRDQFGLSDAQMARSLDRYLDNYLGMRDPAARNRFIADQFFGRGGQPTTPAAVAEMIAGQPVPPPPLRALSAANPSPAPILAPAPPRPAPRPGNLDSRFGPAQPPQGWRSEELLPGGGIRANPGVVQVNRGTPPRLNPDVGYLWLVDDQGRLLVAQERFVVEGGRLVLNPLGQPGRLGHPAMVNGRPARIAGELRYVDGRGWVLDNNSGRYSRYNKALTPAHLDNVADLFQQAGVGVQTRFFRESW